MNLKHKITELPIPPELYETDRLESVDWTKVRVMMTRGT